MASETKEEVLQRIEKLHLECLDILEGLRELNNNLSKNNIKGINPYATGAYKRLKIVIKQRKRILIIQSSFLETLEAQKKLLKLKKRYERK